MLHSVKPADYALPPALVRPWQCCNCNNSFVFGDGFIMLAHYIDRQTRETQHGLMCFCSSTCALSFESTNYMARA